MDYIEIIIFAIVVIFSLLAGDRRKKQQRQQQPPPSRTRRPPPRPARRAAVPPRAREYESPSDARTLAEQILEQIRARQEQETRQELDLEEASEAEPVRSLDAYALKAPIPEVRSLETLEAAGEASHQRFHDKYVAPPQAVEFPGLAAQRHVTRPPANPRSAREAIVWMAILGKPKGLP